MAKQNVKVLFCTCNSCTHWELIKFGRKKLLKCKSCNEVFDITFNVAKHDAKVQWLEREDV